MKSKNFVYVSILCLIVTSAFFAYSSQETAVSDLIDLDQFEAFVRTAMDKAQFPGVAIAIVEGNKVILAKGYGIRTVGKDEPVDENTLFAIGDVTKSFTSAALGLLVQDRKISWDDHLADLLPGFQVEDPYVTHHVTIRDALSHRSGVKYVDDLWKLYPSRSPREVIKKIALLPQAIEFRSGWIYNSLLYTAAGEVIPEITGQSWHDFVENQLLVPIGMTRSNTSISKLKGDSNVATPHTLDKGQIIAMPYMNSDGAAPGVGINSTAKDMAQWCKFHLNRGEVDGKKILSKRIVVELHKPESFSPQLRGAFGSHYGFYTFGLGRTDYRGKGWAYFHNGNSTGMSAGFAFLPEKNIAVCALVNCEVSEIPIFGMTVAQWIFDHVLMLDDIDTLAEFLEECTAIRKRQKRAEDTLFKNRVAGTSPAYQSSDYAGTYEHPISGTFVVTVEGESLKVQLGETSYGALEHWHYETFLVKQDPTRRLDLLRSGYLGRGPMLVTFSADKTGLPASVTLSPRQWRRDSESDLIYKRVMTR